MQDDSAQEGAGAPLEELKNWWQQTAAEGLADQQEVFEWWMRLMRCSTDLECGSRKVRTLCERLSATMMATAASTSRLALDQHLTAADLFRESGKSTTMGSPGAVNTAAFRFWSGVADMLRPWEMIAVSSRAQTASAWAEFWSLPSAAEPGS